MVVEHIHKVVMSGVPRVGRARYSDAALELILTLIKQAQSPGIDPVWVHELLESAAEGGMRDETFILFLRLRGSAKEEDDGKNDIPIIDDKTDPGHQLVVWETSTPAYTFFSKVLNNIKTCSERDPWWGDDAVYGGLLAIRDIRQLGTCSPEGFLEVLFDAMENVDTTKESNVNKKARGWRVRKGAYDVIMAARDQWLRSPDLRQTLQDLDFPRRLHSVVTAFGRSDHRHSFLIIIEILSEGVYWHSYLRGAMDIWLPFYQEGRKETIRILANIGRILSPYTFDDSLTGYTAIINLVKDEWAQVPGRGAADLRADLLTPLADITKQLRMLVFSQRDRLQVLAVVDGVIPSLEKRREYDGHEGLGEDIRGIIEDLLVDLRVPCRKQLLIQWTTNYSIAHIFSI